MNTQLIAVLAEGSILKRVSHRLPAFLVIDIAHDGVFLYRYDEHGECAGDTWHASVDDAKHQAEFEHDGSACVWRPVPNDIDDVVAFGVSLLR